MFGLSVGFWVGCFGYFLCVGCYVGVWFGCCVVVVIVVYFGGGWGGDFIVWFYVDCSYVGIGDVEFFGWNGLFGCSFYVVFFDGCWFVDWY